MTATVCFTSLASVLLLGAICSVAARAAETPALLGQLVVDAPVVSMRVTPDGKRLLAQLQTAKGQSTEIRIVDTSDPRQPATIGRVAIVKAGELAVSPDGRKLLFAVEIEKHKWGTKSGRYQLTAIDISNPRQPKKEWQRTVVAREIALAPDASAYALSQPSQGLDEHWKVVVTWLDRQRDPLTLPASQYEDTAGLRLSPQGNFLTYGSDAQLKIDDLRGQAPAHFEQGYRGTGQSSCLITNLDKGYLLVEDRLAPRFGVYAPQVGIPRVATLDHGVVSTINECQFHLLAASGSNVLLADATGRVYQLDAIQPKQTRLARILAFPQYVWQSTIDSANHIYTSQNKNGQIVIGIYDLSRTIPVTVDWKALKAAWDAALRIYGDKERDELNRLSDALQKFEEAAPILALDAPVKEISSKTAAAILNDYAFLLSKDQSWRLSDIKALLDRSISLDPDRASAHLNLADLLRGSLSRITNWPSKQATRGEAEEHYRKYLALGGKDTEAINAFLRDGLDSPPPTDICAAIVNYANAGRLTELVTDTGIDIPRGGKKFDLLFTTEGTAHVPTFYAFNSVDDTPADEGAFSLPDNDNLWGGDELGLVVYQNTVQILHYRDLHHPVASSSVSGDQHCYFSFVGGIGG